MEVVLNFLLPNSWQTCLEVHKEIYVITLLVSLRYHLVIITWFNKIAFWAKGLFCVFDGVGVTQTENGCKTSVQNRWWKCKLCQTPAFSADIAMLFISFLGSLLIRAYRGRRVQCYSFLNISMIFRVFLCLKHRFTAQSLDEGSFFLYLGNEISLPLKTALQLERKSFWFVSWLYICQHRANTNIISQVRALLETLT